MNERIQQLAEQCYEHDQSWTGVGQRIFNKEKFAELIVRECADYVDSAISDGGVDGRSLKEHFGVK